MHYKNKRKQMNAKKDISKIWAEGYKRLSRYVLHFLPTLSKISRFSGKVVTLGLLLACLLHAQSPSLKTKWKGEMVKRSNSKRSLKFCYVRRSNYGEDAKTCSKLQFLNLVIKVNITDLDELYLVKLGYGGFVLGGSHFCYCPSSLKHWCKQN